MPNVFVQKLSRFAVLSNADKRALTAAIRKVGHVPARRDIIEEGDAPDFVHLILDGFACRYKILPDGSRQIVAYLVPGDFCDLHVFLLGQMDHSIGALSACTVVYIPRDTITKLLLESSAVASALLMATLVDEATLREWLANIGRRSAVKRLAHLLCELLLRLEVVGLVKGDTYSLPLRQIDLADTLSMSIVHINRSLQKLRKAGMVTYSQRTLKVLDPIQLKKFSEFNPNYLHLPKQLRPLGNAR